MVVSSLGGWRRYPAVSVSVVFLFESRCGMCTGIEPFLFGTAATAETAATAGLIGAGGAFSAAPALMTAGTVLSTVGQVQQGSAQQKAYNAQAQQALNEGAYRADAAKQQAEKFRRAGKVQASAAKAQLAASGVKLGDGTPLEIDQQITQNAEEDALSSMLSADRAKSAAQQEAKLLGNAGQNAMTSSVLSAGGTFIKSGWKTRLSKGGE